MWFFDSWIPLFNLDLPVFFIFLFFPIFTLTLVQSHFSLFFLEIEIFVFVYCTQRCLSFGGDHSDEECFLKVSGEQGFELVDKEMEEEEVKYWHEKAYHQPLIIRDWDSRR